MSAQITKTMVRQWVNDGLPEFAYAELTQETVEQVVAAAETILCGAEISEQAGRAIAYRVTAAGAFQQSLREFSSEVADKGGQLAVFVGKPPTG